MLWIRKLLGVAILAPAIGAENPSVVDRPTDAISPKAPTRLFNGKDLQGLYTWLQDSKREDPRHVFTVHAGMIHVSGDGFGYLSTERAYKDFRLVVEFKWGERNWRGRERHARDSGIFLHSKGADGNSRDGKGAYKAAIECQIMQGSVGDLLLIAGKLSDGTNVPTRLSAKMAPKRDTEGWPYWQKDGARIVLQRGRLNWFGKATNWEDRLDFRGANDVESPGFDWTQVECVCDGRSIQVLVNGTLVNEANEVTPCDGPILLQCEGSEILFRRFELLPLK